MRAPFPAKISNHVAQKLSKAWREVKAKRSVLGGEARRPPDRRSPR
jgi:hypothetical protein